MATNIFGVIVAAVIAFAVANHQLTKQKESERKREVRGATMNYIKAIQDLLGASSAPTAELRPYRSRVGTENILYGMVVGDNIDKDRLFILADVVIKSSGVAHKAHQACFAGEPLFEDRARLVYLVARPFIDALEDVESGTLHPSELANTVWAKYLEILEEPRYKWDVEIREELKKTKFPSFQDKVPS